MIPAHAAAEKNIRCAMVVKNYVLRTLFTLLVVLSVISCDFDPKDDPLETFWAMDFTTGVNYKLKAEIAATGSYCTVWVERDNSTGKAQAQNIADTYDNKVHLQMIEAFGLENPSLNGTTFSDIMKFADYLGDGDGKLCILLLDIKDGYKKGVNDSYVAGYFWAGNFMDMQGSNKRDMIYIDTSPGMDNGKIDSAITTLAHEMQHLMNFVTSAIKRSTLENGTINVASMDTWIDEGLSSAAEYVINGHSMDRISWYNNNGIKDRIKGSIDIGNNFFVWDNHTDENKYAVLDDYSTVYLFFQWLRLQKGGGLEIYRDIISSTHVDYRAVTSAMNNAVWDDLLRNWMAANYINSSSGVYGYKDEFQIAVHYAPKDITKINLYSGEGVYSFTEAGFTMPSQSGNIKYAGLNNTTVSDTSVYASGALLTYNKSIELAQEEGIITGKAPPSASIASSNGRSIISSYSGPFRIGGGDLLRMNGSKKEFILLNLQDR
jgi:hypothetical protein